MSRPPVSLSGLDHGGKSGLGHGGKSGLGHGRNRGWVMDAIGVGFKDVIECGDCGKALQGQRLAPWDDQIRTACRFADVFGFAFSRMQEIAPHGSRRRC